VRIEVFTAMFNLGSGANGLFDADGSSIMIHALADDYTTDPSGSSGGRIACGEVSR
jgi:Cu-Zn family superoxide dismutase